MGGRSRREFVRRALLAGTGMALAPVRRIWAMGGEVVVTTPSGRLAGGMEGGVRVFRGVPFAEPPVGPLRFRAPVSVRPWVGVREATQFRSAAMQEPHGGIALSEDCLYLNVWAPVGNGPFPVFVWIHGGGYTGGEAFAPIFDGTGFAQSGIVLVTVAYRLGVFGYMDLEPLLGAGYADSANNGTRDMVAALAWVHANIAAFGGDPGRVTVGGESAGAKSVAALMTIPEAAGLFQGAVSESGGGERVFPRAVAARVAGEYAAAWTADGGAVEALRTAEAARLIAVQERYLQGTALHFPFRVEVGALPGRALLPESPIAAMQAAGWKGKRLLIGTNRDESALFVGSKPSGVVTANELGNLPLEVFERVYARYPAVYGASAGGAGEMTVSQREIQALTAEEYWVPSVRVADANARSGGATWMYRLDFARTEGRMAGEAFHSEDLGFLWDKLSKEERGEAGAVGLARAMHAAWVAFVKGGAPAAEGLPEWPRYDAGERPTMILNRASRVERRPAEAELRVWDGLLE